MKVQREPVYFTCTANELTSAGTPPVTDEKGTPPPANAICELLNVDKSIRAYFQWDGAAWYQYGEAPTPIPPEE